MTYIVAEVIIILRKGAKGKMQFNERVRKYMDKNGYSQKQLSKLSGITEASMSKYLSGERTPRIDVVVSLAKALGISVDELIGDDEKLAGEFDFDKLKGVLARGKRDLTEEQKLQLIKILSI